MAFWLGNNFEKVKRDSRRMTLSNKKPFLTRLGGCQLDVLFSVTSFQFTFSLLKMTFLLCGCPLCPHIFKRELKLLALLQFYIFVFLLFLFLFHNLVKMHNFEPFELFENFEAFSVFAFQNLRFFITFQNS